MTKMGKILAKVGQYLKISPSNFKLKAIIVCQYINIDDFFFTTRVKMGSIWTKCSLYLNMCLEYDVHLGNTSTGKYFSQKQ